MDSRNTDDMADKQRKEPHLKRLSLSVAIVTDSFNVPEPPKEPTSLDLSPEERRLFGQLFAAADTDKIGVVTGEVAVEFFKKTRLSPDILGEVACQSIRVIDGPQTDSRYADMVNRGL